MLSAPGLRKEAVNLPPTSGFADFLLAQTVLSLFLGEPSRRFQTLEKQANRIFENGVEFEGHSLLLYAMCIWREGRGEVGSMGY
jgi:hypothetical protein